MNLAEGVPNYICPFGGTNEKMFLKLVQFTEHGIAIFNKGYSRYSSFEKWGSSNRYFVTRKKVIARYRGVLDFDCPHSQDIIKDQLISLNYRD